MSDKDRTSPQKPQPQPDSSQPEAAAQDAPKAPKTESAQSAPAPKKAAPARRTPRTFDQADKLKNVFYDIRGPLSAEAERMEAEGHTILKLNTGNPAVFGFDAPDVIMRDMIANLPTSQGYSTSKGILPARRAVVKIGRAHV